MKIEELKILIVEDEVLIAEFLKDILNDFGVFKVDLAHNKKMALEVIERFQPNLILLDIRMEEELQGIEIAIEIGRKFKVPFIFITAHSDEQIIQQALETKPFAYITKPVKKMDVYAAINLALNSISEKAVTYLLFKDGHTEVRLDHTEILYAKSIGNYVTVYTPGKKYNIRYSMDWLSENLPLDSFLRVHRSYLVNVKKIEKNSFKSLLVNGVEIPKSRNLKLNLE